MPAIGIITGSDSDIPRIEKCFSILEEFGVEYECIVSSAHRTPEQTVQWVSSARDRGIKAIIAAAGGAAHLPGVVAAHTTLPVIGVPIETNMSGGLDSLLSIAQMPSGIPVGTMAAGKSGGANAALFALSILSVHDSSIEEKLLSYRARWKESIDEKNKRLKEGGYRAFIKQGEN
jgi:phosphoribosylaminoimidazole carboxylase PurE protein